MFILAIRKITMGMFLLLNVFVVYAHASNDKNILVLGDSLSAEYGLKAGSGWVEIIKEKLKNQNNSFQIVNISISGETTSGGLNRLNNAIQQYQPAILIIELGANDALQGLDLNQTSNNIQQMIDLANTNQASTLLIGMLLPPNYGKQYTQQFANIFTTLSEKNNLALVPFLFAGFETNQDYFQKDRIHPNEKAQSIMANNVWAKLKTILKD